MRRTTERHWLTRLALCLVLGACAEAPPAPTPLTVAVFKVEPRQLRLTPRLLARLHRYATSVVETHAAFRTVPREQLLRTLRKRRVRAERDCYSARCQAKLGRRSLGANRAVSLQVTRNLLGQCDVFGLLQNLGTRSNEQKAHARAGCSEEEIAQSLGRVVCRLAASASTAEARDAAESRCLAQADYLWVEQRLAEFGDDRKPLDERRLAETALDLRREYDRIIRTGALPWSVVAVCRTGRLYEELARRLGGPAADEAQAPRGTGEPSETARQQQEAAQRLRAAPYVDQARQIYTACLHQAKQAKLSHPQVEEARQRLHALDSPAAP